ncbi:MAG: hypothetical protein VZR27_02150 [Acutalibacteraceae bacterium]|nr:hypothetical protein [Clostridia bacterium]MEE3449493.1 hypothetical protein [Acutalibacteraceae bacterium]
MSVRKTEEYDSVESKGASKSIYYITKVSYNVYDLYVEKELKLNHSVSEGNELLCRADPFDPEDIIEQKSILHKFYLHISGLMALNALFIIMCLRRFNTKYLIKIV